MSTRSTAAVVSAALAASAAVVARPTAAAAAPIVIYSTGTGTAGSVDPHYTLVSSADASAPGPAAYVSTSVPSSYVPNDALSSWISPEANATTSLAGGNYTYQTTFDLTGLVPSTAQLVGKWAADNGGVIDLNGVSTGVSLPVSDSSFTALTAFSITSGFVAGVNTLDFVVTNQSGGATPTALRAYITGTASTSVPEPASAVLGLSGVGLLGRRRRGTSR